MAEAKPSKTVPNEALAQKITSAEPDPHQKQFFESLVSRMESLQNQNRDLLDQLAETNRDLMKLQFRVDTHSESFRPLPVSEDRPFTSLDDEIGVLPPRAEPVMLPAQ
jgi:predicted RNase H-like nuclease (RuvC/YqgF family)